MTVLRDADIHKLGSGGLVAPFNPDHVRSASYDLTAGWIFTKVRKRRWLGGLIGSERLSVIDATSKERGTTVFPGQVLTILTAETVKIPADMIGTVFPINAKSEEGMLVLNPGHVDPGYEGLLSIRMVNLRQSQTYLAVGDKVFTLILERLESPVDRPFPASEKLAADARVRRMKDKVAGSMSPSMLDVAGDLLAGDMEGRFIRRDRFEWELLKVVVKFLGLVALILGLLKAFGVLHLPSSASAP